MLTRFSGSSVFGMITTIAETMPADSPGSLSWQEYTDVVAYMLQLNEVPAGDSELSADQAQQSGIKVELRAN
jgi:hypothetical protein